MQQSVIHNLCNACEGCLWWVTLSQTQSSKLQTTVRPSDKHPHTFEAFQAGDCDWMGTSCLPYKSEECGSNGTSHETGYCNNVFIKEEKTRLALECNHGVLSRKKQRVIRRYSFTILTSRTSTFFIVEFDTCQRKKNIHSQSDYQKEGNKYLNELQ